LSPIRFDAHPDSCPTPTETVDELRSKSSTPARSAAEVGWDAGSSTASPVSDGIEIVHVVTRKPRATLMALVSTALLSSPSFFLSSTSSSLSVEMCVCVCNIYHFTYTFHMHMQRHTHTSTHAQSAHKRNSDNQAQEPG